MRKFILFILALLLAETGKAQYAMSPLNFQQKHLLDEHLSSNRQLSQTAFAPYLISEAELDSVFTGSTDNWSPKSHESWVMRKLRNEHLIEVDEPHFKLKGDAVFNLEAARQLDAQGRRLFTNSRGFQFTGTIGERFFFGTSFYENQSILPAYMDSVVSARGDFNSGPDPERGSIPGYGRWKPFNTSDSYDYDYTLGTGYVGFAFARRSFIQLGHDKQFLGYGYRSLLLSDASTPYPFLRLHLSMLGDRLTYSTTWAVLQSLERVAPVNYNSKEAMFRRLGARFSYLHFQPTHWVGLGLFDATTWTWRGNSSPASIEYYSPHAWFYTGRGIRNHIIGVNGFVSPLPALRLYGQFGLNSGTSGRAVQLGLKWLGLPQHLVLTLEYNKIGEGFYFDGTGASSGNLISEPFQPGTSVFDYYQHNDQSLGHPLLVASDELLLKVHYRLRGFFAEASYHKMKKTPVSAPSEIDYFQFEGGYIINSKSNAQIAIGNINRTEQSANSGTIDTYTYLAFRTTLLNRYLDF